MGIQIQKLQLRIQIEGLLKLGMRSTAGIGLTDGDHNIKHREIESAVGCKEKNRMLLSRSKGEGKTLACKRNHFIRMGEKDRKTPKG